MATRGVRAAVPEELKKHTRQEQRDKREAKKQEAETAKACKVAEQQGNKSKAAKRVAALEDKQMLEDKQNQSLRPDLDMADGLPKISQQSVASILNTQFKPAPSTVYSQSPEPPVTTVNTLPADPSPSPSPIASPHFELASISRDDELLLADGNDFPQGSSLHTSESEGPPNEYGGSEGKDASEGVAGNVHGDSDQMGAYSENEASPNSEGSEYKGSEGSDSESEVSNPDNDPESALPATSALDLEKEFKKFMEMRMAAQAEAELKKKGKGAKKTKKTPSERKDERLEIRREIIAQRNEVPKNTIEVKPASATTKKRKDTDTDEQRIDSQKRAKAEVGGLAKDWRSVCAQSIAMSSASPMEMPVSVPVKIEKAGKKASSKEMAKSPPEIVLKDVDVQEIDVGARGKKSSWKNKDLPFDHFVTDLPIWQQKFLPSLIDWANCSIAEPFGTTNHKDFKATTLDLWTKFFAHLPPKLADESIRAEHPAIYSVAAAAIRTHRSDIGKEALKVMDRIWDSNDMRGCTSEEDRSAWVKNQLNGSSFLYKFQDEKGNHGAFRGRLVMETFAFHLQAAMNAPYSVYGNPIAGLALAASAVKRALMVWKGGFNSIKTRSSTESNSRNNENSFKDDPYGTVANKYYKALVGFDDTKWAEIVLDSAQYLNTKKTKNQAQGSATMSVDGIVDGDDDIAMSP